MGAAAGRRVDPSSRPLTGIVRSGAIALGLAAIVNGGIVTLASMAGIGEDLMALGYLSVLALTALGVAGATFVYAALARFTARPDRLFVIVAAIVLVLSVLPDFVYIPDEPGGSLAAGVVLASMHVITATIALWQLVDWEEVR